jgi:mono/diheme cytochrome c family protein
MPRTLLPIAMILGAILLPLAGHLEPLTELQSLKLEVPTSDTKFPTGTGSDAINNNCLACHSADHVLNQPSLPKATWEEVVNKMINAYKAPITSKDAAEIVEYLTRTKGTK